MNKQLELAEELDRMATYHEAQDREVVFVSVNELRKWAKTIRGFGLLRAAQDGEL